jgi:hypothetical protein
VPGIDRGTLYPVLSSDWTGLNPLLIASFFPVRRIVEGVNVRWEREPSSVEVQAPLTDGMIEQTANWTSPFENQTADAKLSSLSSMLQMGGFSAILNALQERVGKDGALGGQLDSANSALKNLEGKTAVTKLNSTQIFSGMPPLKITATAHFRALYDPTSEVSAPMDQLMQWTLPKKLSTQGLVGNVLDSSQEKGWRTVYPSEAPQIIGMRYADMLFMPMVLEALPQPLTTPRDSFGRAIHSSMTFSIGSLTALDKDDWRAVRQY